MSVTTTEFIRNRLKLKDYILSDIGTWKGTACLAL